MLDCARTVPFVVPAIPVPQPPPPLRPKATRRARPDSAPATLAPQLFAESDQLSAALHRRVESFQTFSIDADGNQLWPKNLPPGTELAGACIEHRGSNILACTVCETEIPIRAFVTHDSISNAHLRTTGSICNLGPRIRKRKAQKDADKPGDDTDY